jgi:hypothetical protein
LQGYQIAADQSAGIQEERSRPLAALLLRYIGGMLWRNSRRHGFSQFRGIVFTAPTLDWTLGLKLERDGHRHSQRTHSASADEPALA